MTRRSSSSDPEPTPSSVSESDGSDNLQEYQYESEGEQRLGESARRLYQASGRDYRRESNFQDILTFNSVFFQLRVLQYLHTPGV